VPPNTSVDVQGMALAQQDFEAATAQVNSAYNSMAEQQASLAAAWTGEAATAFGHALIQFLDDLQAVGTELQAMTQTLATHTGVYSNSATTTVDTATQFSKGLPGI